MRNHGQVMELDESACGFTQPSCNKALKNAHISQLNSCTAFKENICNMDSESYHGYQTVP
jgi:hypothetical protein